MGKQKKGFNWKARQQGGTLETDVVARLVAFMALLCFKSEVKQEPIFLQKGFILSIVVQLFFLIIVANGQVEGEGGSGWS